MDKKYEDLDEEMADYWNTRIIKHIVKGKYDNGKEYHETYYGVHEVYYYKNGEPAMWTEEPIDVTFEDKEELEELLKQISDAAERTVLELDEKTGTLIDTKKLIGEVIKWK